MKKFIGIIAICLLMLSCDQLITTKLPGSTGKTFELMIVSDTQIWESDAGETVRKFFNQQDSTMFLPEPMFTTPQITPKQLEDNAMFRYFKNILIIEIKEDLPLKVTSQDTLWAKPQLVIKITAPSTAAFIETFNVYKDYLLKKYVEIEREKLNIYYNTALNKQVVKSVGEKFGFTFTIPTGFYLAKDKEDFMWLRSETSKISVNIMIYTENYISEYQLDDKYIRLKRNIITESNIPASLDSSYAKISDVFPITSHVVDFKGMYAKEVRGAWDSYNDVMGGTFLNYTIADTASNRVITLDGFVYFPNKEKRALMMQLESMFWSLKQYK